jgi:hypothetical protein
MHQKPKKASGTPSVSREHLCRGFAGAMSAFATYSRVLGHFAMPHRAPGCGLRGSLLRLRPHPLATPFSRRQAGDGPAFLPSSPTPLSPGRAVCPGKPRLRWPAGSPIRTPTAPLRCRGSSRKDYTVSEKLASEHCLSPRLSPRNVLKKTIRLEIHVHASLLFVYDFTTL